MPGEWSPPIRGASSLQSLGERVRFHLARWGLLVAATVFTWLALPPSGLSRLREDPGRIAAGPLLFDGLLLSIFWLLLLFYRRETYNNLREVGFFAGLFGLVVVLSAILLRVFPNRPELLPIPFAAILITLLYNGRLAVFGAATLAMLLAVQSDTLNYPILLFGLTGGVAAALSLRAVRRRSQVYLTIGVVFAADAVAALALGLRFGWIPDVMMRSALIGGVTALGCTSVALVVLPVAEWATRVTTDLTLLELSDPSRPLLRRLSLEAPGTWAHSIQMANLCESACNAIGANGLLARVGCYYHDVGKLANPRYFVENQAHGVNPHDRLDPLESARIVRGHVEDGLRLAAEARLPEAVRRFIPEHHGTSRLDYFVEQAKSRRKNLDPDLPDFRYPGPRPRSAETAIAMLADSTEAAVRTLDEPTPGRVREAVERLVERRVASGQLRDTPLTLRDLHRVTQEFIRVLTGMYHSRIDYPREAGGVSAESGREP